MIRGVRPRCDDRRPGCASACAASGSNEHLADRRCHELRDDGVRAAAACLRSRAAASGITVRAARPGERITLLDDKEYSLDPEFHADRGRRTAPVGLAGIMGGQGHRDRRRARPMCCSSPRISRPPRLRAARGGSGSSPMPLSASSAGSIPACRRSPSSARRRCLLEIAGGEPGPVQVTRAGEAPAQPLEWVSLRRSRLARLLGANVPGWGGRARSSHRSASGWKPEAQGWRVRRPPHRFDITHRGGFDRGGRAPARLRQHRRGPRDRAADRRASPPSRACRTSGCSRRWPIAGYREAITYSFVDPAVAAPDVSRDAGLSRCRIPISADLSEMRVSLWSGLIPACRENMRRQQSRVRLFEIGNKFDVVGRRACARSRRSRGVATGARWPEQWGSAREPLDFYDVKARRRERARARAAMRRELRFEAEHVAVSCVRDAARESAQ